MTGYSTPHGPAALHPAGCTCPACIDVSILAEDNAAIGRADWIDARRETTQQAAERAANEKVAEHDEWLEHLADQYEDMRDWRWSIGVID